MLAKLLKATEIAEILNISKALAYQLIASGQIPSVRFGRTVRVRQEDLDAFIENNKTKDKDASLVQLIESPVDRSELHLLRRQEARMW